MALSRKLRRKRWEKKIDERIPPSPCLSDYEDVLPALYVSVRVNGKKIKFQVDTGSDVSTITTFKKRKHLPNLKTKSCSHAFINFDNTVSRPVGVIENVTLTFGDVVAHDQLLYVVKENLATVIGKNWLFALHVWPIKFKPPRYRPLNILDPLHIFIQPSCKPIKMAAHAVPSDMVKLVQDEIDRLVKSEKIVPVKSSEWCTPLVPMIEKGSITLYWDYRLTINKYIKGDNFSVLSPKHILNKLKGNSYFCKLKLNDKNFEIPLDGESQHLLTVITAKGMFQPLYLPFGVNFGPMMQHKYVSNILRELDIIVHSGYIYVYGKSYFLTSKKLTSVFKRLQESGLTIIHEDSLFFSETIDKFGNNVSKQGIIELSENIEPLLKLPRPKDVVLLESFKSIINYYNTSLKSVESCKEILFTRLKGKRFIWTNEFDRSFKMALDSLLEATTVDHLRKDSTIVLSCSASPRGVAAVMSVIDKHLVVKPMAFAYRNLNKIETKYSNLEKDACAVMFGVQRYDEYLYGQKFILEINSKEIQKMLESNSNATSMSNQLRYWLICLSRYNFTIMDTTDTNNPSIYLSRVGI